MRIALVSSRAALPGAGSEFGRHVLKVTRMLRFLGHECVLVGVTARPPLGPLPGHAGGTRARLLQEVPNDAVESGWEVLGLEAVLEEERPDVVWLLQRQGARDVLAAAGARAIPVVADFHGLSCAVDAGGSPGDRRAADELRYVLSGADAVVAHLESDRAAAQGAGIPDGRIHLVPFGADHTGAAHRSLEASTNTEPGPGGNPNGGGLTIGFVGPLARAGGAHVLLEALALAPDLAVRVRIAGRGPGEADYEERLGRTAEADGRVQVLPAGGNGRAHEPVDLVVLPSLTPACPVLVLEAIGSGVPVVASDRSGAAELTGVEAAFEAGDAAALAALLERIVSEPGAVARLREAPSSVPGIEQEALEMERVARRVADAAGRASSRRTSEPVEGPTRLVGGGIDFPFNHTTIPRTAVQLTGWALCSPQPVSRVSVNMNGQVLGRARFGLARPVLLEAFSSPEAAVCGFEHWIDLTGLPDDTEQITLSADIVALDGSSFPLSPIQVTVAPSSTPSAEDLDRAKVLEERLQRIAGSAGRGTAPAKGRVRLVVFSHLLGYGGAQLYLFELLRRLSAEPWFECTVVAPSDGPLRRACEELGIAVHITDFPRVDEVDLYEGNLIEFAAWIRNEGFNAALGNTLLAFPWMGLMGRLGIPSLWAIHESYDLSIFWAIHLPDAEIHPLVGRRITDALRSASALVFVADATRRMFEPYADARRLVKIDYGIDMEGIRAYRASFDRAATRARLGIPEDARVILCLGAIEPRKSQTMLARAFRRISDACPDAFLALVGDPGGDYSQSLREYLDAAGLSGRSRVVKVVRDTNQWYGVADLFVLPSDLESLPRSVLEAMAFDVPVAAANAFGLPELIEDGVTGYLCEPRDLGRLCDLLEKVLSLPADELRRVGEAGGRAVRGRDSAGYAAGYGRLLRGLVDDPGAFPGDFVLGSRPADAAGSEPPLP